MVNCITKNNTKEDRAKLFDEIFENMVKRESVVAIKEKRLGLNFKRDLLRCRDEVINADTDEKLLYALTKMNNARKDPHCRIYMVKDGIKIDGVEVEDEPIRLDSISCPHAPIIFNVDYADLDNRFMFIADMSKDIQQYCSDVAPSIGDKLIAVNGIEFSTYYHLVEPYHRSATINNLWSKMSVNIAKRTYTYPPHIFKDDLTLTLEARDGKQYELVLPYIEDAKTIEWQGFYKRPGEPRYTDFVRVLANTTYDLYKYQGDRKVVLIDWHWFNAQEMLDNVDALVDYARENDLFDHDIIFDATRSRGGCLGAYVIQRLVNKPFTTTFGNLRISDATMKFVEKAKENHKAGKWMTAVDGGDWFVEWLNTDFLKAVEEGKEWTDRFPHKMSYMHKDADGILNPHFECFKGDMVGFFNSASGSQLDQTFSMLADNDIAHTIGMSPGGFSKTWQFNQVYYLGKDKKPVVQITHTLGQTIRPNGECIEGNPPFVKEYIAETRDNYIGRYDMLLERAFVYLDGRK